MITASGQRNVVFRFSRPPEDINYFPLREPSRIVIDIKGPIESLPQVAIYKAADPLIGAVRVGSYDGRMRLVVQVAAEELPPFSVQSGHVVLTATLGKQTAEAAPKQKDAQILFIAENARLDQLAQAQPVVDKLPYLRNTPGIGWLFKGKDDSRTKDELLIFLTPTIVAGVSTTTLPSANQLWENRPGGGVRP